MSVPSQLSSRGEKNEFKVSLDMAIIGSNAFTRLLLIWRHIFACISSALYGICLEIDRSAFNFAGHASAVRI